MTPSLNDDVYPRPLSTREREWIEWVLPANRAGYRGYREMIQSMKVLGEGRRGNGEIILGGEGVQPDLSAPLPAVFAYGAIETTFGTISITVREVADDQISVEIVGHRMEEIPPDVEESRRWTYSMWSPRESCPQCKRQVREVAMHTVIGRGGSLTLAICIHDKRLWVFDSVSEVNHLIPVTNFYNELMLHKNIRDPEIALQSKRFFEELSQYSDADLTYAFLTYNKIKTKVHLQGIVEPDRWEEPSFLKRLANVFRKES
ncbi:MAG: hypothetical protein HYR76_11405 [Ignavibacteria bacterium]|nr:hypothetical protein [Ignavibacteria bacterium]MBI3766686.1 hypothetical protein [Ignavibacteriales bacterium]